MSVEGPRRFDYALPVLLARLEAQQAAFDRHLIRIEAHFAFGLAALGAHAGVLAARSSSPGTVAALLLVLGIGVFLAMTAWVMYGHRYTSLYSPPEPEHVYYVLDFGTAVEDLADSIHNAVVRNRPRVQSKARAGGWCFRLLVVQCMVTVLGISLTAL